MVLHLDNIWHRSILNISVNNSLSFVNVILIVFVILKQGQQIW